MTDEDDFIADFATASAYPEVAAAAAAVRAGDWPAFRSVYLRAPTWRQRQMIMSGGDSVSGSETFLRAVMERERDLVAGTMLGARLVDIAWEIRGAGYAKDVSKEQFRGFHEVLRQAEGILAWVCAQDPTFVPAWVERLPVAMGLSLGASEARRRYDQVARLDPHNLHAQEKLLQVLAPKWAGDWDSMWRFARDCTAASPAGAHNAALIMDAHLEKWLDTRENTWNFDYFDDDAIRQEIRAAGERSVLHPDFDRGLGWVFPVSVFALGYSVIGDWATAKRLFVDLGPYADQWGWQYLGKPVTAFANVRKQAFKYG